MKKEKLITGIDLFCGAGGHSCGFMKAGIRVLGGIDYSPDVLRTYIYNLGGPETEWIGKKPTEGRGKKKKEFTPTGHNTGKFKHPINTVICDDITNWKGKDVLKAMKCENDLDILYGGPPCQGFSTSNYKRCVTDPRSQLMWQFIRLIGEIKPRYFEIENVSGIMTYKDFVYVLMESLEKHGYVVRINMIDCVSYGVPQHRKRILIHGTRKDIKKMIGYPVPTHFDPKQMKSDGIAPTQAEVAIYAFAKHGFPKEELKDLWWNTKLWIYMNKKKAEETIDNAVQMALIERMTGKKPEDFQWFGIKLPEIKQTTINNFI